MRSNDNVDHLCLDVHNEPKGSATKERVGGKWGRGWYLINNRDFDWKTFQNQIVLLLFQNGNLGQYTNGSIQLLHFSRERKTGLAFKRIKLLCLQDNPKGLGLQ